MSGEAENWRDVLGFEGIYEVSSKGRVRSLDKRVKCGYGRTRTVKGRVLSPALVQGYPTVGLNHEGKQTMARVHRLVCTAFHGLAPSEAHEVAHADGDPGNARAENLRWATHQQNEADKVRHGTSPHGTRHPMAKLDEQKVRQIREDTGPYATISARYGVSKSLVCLIKQGRLWRNAA